MIKGIYSFLREYASCRRNISLKEFLKYKRYIKSNQRDTLIGIQALSYEHPIYLRQNRVDFSIFRDFFLKDDYAPTIPQARIIIDAGANIGAATLTFKKRYPDAEIVAIEPDEDNCRLFYRNTDQYKGITLLQGGLASRHNAFMKILDTAASSYSYQMQYSDSGLPSFSINGLMQERGWTELDIVKIDIEGGEKELFVANTEWLSRTKQIIIELHDYKLPGCSAALIQAIKDYEFNISFSGENLILTKPDIQTA